MPQLIVLVPYFGQWPEWINLFVESCKWNSEIRWQFYTDCGEPENTAQNVHYIHVSFNEYRAMVRDRLGIKFNPCDPHKLCDLKPCLGHLHEHDIRAYHYFGYCDIDIVFGNLRKFYTDDVLASYDVISTHPDIVSGHFAVFRNTSSLRHAYESIPKYFEGLGKPNWVGLDEAPFAAVIRDVQSPRINSLFVEQYSTIFSPRGWHDGTTNYPKRWLWKKGRLTNDRDGSREFLYLHFMRWKSAKGFPPLTGESAWLNLEHLVKIDWRQAASDGFCVSGEGFTPISSVGELT